MTESVEPVTEAGRRIVEWTADTERADYFRRAVIEAEQQAAARSDPALMERVEGLRGLSEAATPGEWVAWGERGGDPAVSHKPGDGHVFNIARVDSWDRGEANRDLIVAAVNLVRAVLTAAEPAGEQPWCCNPVLAAEPAGHVHRWDTFDFTTGAAACIDCNAIRAAEPADHISRSGVDAELAPASRRPGGPSSEYDPPRAGDVAISEAERNHNVSAEPLAAESAGEQETAETAPRCAHCGHLWGDHDWDTGLCKHSFCFHSADYRSAASTDSDDGLDYMCPNCVTPWKCNGPHRPELTRYGAAEPAGEQETARLTGLPWLREAVKLVRSDGPDVCIDVNTWNVLCLFAGVLDPPAASQGEGGVT